MRNNLLSFFFSFGANWDDKMHISKIETKNTWLHSHHSSFICSKTRRIRFLPWWYIFCTLSSYKVYRWCLEDQRSQIWSSCRGSISFPWPCPPWWWDQGAGPLDQLWLERCGYEPLPRGWVPDSPVWLRSGPGKWQKPIGQFVDLLHLCYQTAAPAAFTADVKQNDIKRKKG